MNLTIHHSPKDASSRYYLHAWADGRTWDVDGTPSGPLIDFTLPGVVDPRRLQLMFRKVDGLGKEIWEPNDFIRKVRKATPSIWSYDDSARIIYQNPAPQGAVIQSGDVISLNVITKSTFAGGQVHVWNPYNPNSTPRNFAETSRTPNDVSTFDITLDASTATGFHFMLTGPGNTWEPQNAVRVWRPLDGKTPWIKSGQVSVRVNPLKLLPVQVEVILPTSQAPPKLFLYDPVEQLSVDFTLQPAQQSPLAPLFKLARYAGFMYPDAIYEAWADPASEGQQITRPFPVDPGNLATVSRFALGSDGYLNTVTAITQKLIVSPRPVGGNFTAGMTVDVSFGTSPVPYQSIPATQQPDGTLTAQFSAIPSASHSIQLRPANASEVKPYNWIDTRRFFTAPAVPATLYTTEGIFGLTTRGPSPFAEPPPGRQALMAAAFPDGVAAANGLFDPIELPHGATILGNDVYFVVHAPHAAASQLVLVNEDAPAVPPSRTLLPMSLTNDGRYWWCAVSKAQASHGARYRFLLNDDLEVMDPAARWVFDSGNFNTNLNDDPASPDTSWSRVFDPAPSRTLVQSAPWDTMTWDAMLFYQIHPKRFTDLSRGTHSSMELLTDELQPTSRLGRPGYLRSFPATAFQLMPLHEFKSTNSWGYNPAYFFAIDSGYGGPEGLAEFVQAAHAAGKGVLLDVVYNHVNDSSLLSIAFDVYRNGSTEWGDKINNAHPMVMEFFRQATVYLWQTFALDGFRFDASSTILDNNGWDFLSTLRWAVRTAASTTSKRWPYFVGENDNNRWNMTNPAWSILDGQWDVDQVSDVGQCAYDSWTSTDNTVPKLKDTLEAPATWTGWPFSAATCYGESHDTAGGVNGANQRIAARPPRGQGFQMAKAVGAVTLLSKSIPLIFMGEEYGETRSFFINENEVAINPQLQEPSSGATGDKTTVLAWFTSLMGLRNDPAKGLRGDSSSQTVSPAGFRTIAFTCGRDQQLFVVATFGTPDQSQNSAWLGLPAGAPYKEIFNSSWPVFQVEFEQERANGGYNARIYSGQTVQLPFAGAVVFERT